MMETVNKLLLGEHPRVRWQGGGEDPLVMGRQRQRRQRMSHQRRQWKGLRQKAKWPKEEELAGAAADNKAEAVQRLLEEGVSADAKDGQGKPVIVHAAGGG